MERLTHRRSDGSAYSDLDIQTCLNRLADYEDQSEEQLKNLEHNSTNIENDNGEWQRVTDKTERNWG